MSGEFENWMGSLPNEVKQLPLTHVALPGTKLNGFNTPVTITFFS